MVDMEAFHWDALSGMTLDVQFMLPLVCSPKSETSHCGASNNIKKKRIREKKSLIADAAVMSVADVVVKAPANLTTLRC